jgi:Asp-tRNA(Asn)/Glu-tRNA(Gln) amidotransferase A subunit family amidase
MDTMTHGRSGEAATSDLCEASALELASLIAAGEASSREVVEAHLERIGRFNGELGAVRVVLAEQALAAAEEADRVRASGAALGPLHGVPFTVKENVDVAGTATTHGLAALAGAIASTDAPSVAGLRRAGAIPIGRSNMPDLATRWHTESGVGGTTRRIAVSTAGCEPDVSAAVRRAAGALAAAGWEVEEAEPGMTAEATGVWAALVGADVSLLLAQVEPLLNDGARRFLAGTLAGAPPVDVHGYQAALVARHRLGRAWEQAATRPLVLGAICTTAPFPAGAEPPFANMLGRLALTLTANVLGLPAAAAPSPGHAPSR